MRQQPSLFDRITLAGWGLVVAAGLLAGVCAPLLLSWLAPNLLEGDKTTRGTITIVWLALVVTFLVLGGMMLKLCSITLIRNHYEPPGKTKLPSGQNDSEKEVASQRQRDGNVHVPRW